jgi:hypothetical protein
VLRFAVIHVVSSGYGEIGRRAGFRFLLTLGSHWQTFDGLRPFPPTGTHGNRLPLQTTTDSLHYSAGEVARLEIARRAGKSCPSARFRQPTCGTARVIRATRDSTVPTSRARVSLPGHDLARRVSSKRRDVDGRLVMLVGGRTYSD